ncbi:acyl-CoA dehydrogenase family protein [Nocardia lijiangensis]|uniref:acyl-CoA dehydrogenase family protein n=1 Tax=Nocardia lijiangensis TaxID=299618 RepID=UPI00083345D8|nr:acyl-CoA dehydrogenase family protein [Nocardia lijiangensis]
MTTADLPVHETSVLRLDDAGSIVHALREVIFGAHTDLHTRVRDLVAGLGDLPRSGLTYAQEAEAAPGLLRAAIAGLGRPAREIAADTQLRGALCDWAQVTAPRLLLVLTGHFDLAIGAILAHGDGSLYQQECLAELDSGAAVGVLALTELGGTNGADQQTLAEWDPGTGGFWLTTPSPEAVKFMPNVASAGFPKTVVVTARLVVNGRDEGVLPFLLRLRTSAGLAVGVEVAPLHKVSAPMDHAMIKFDRVWLPREALLGGAWARIDEDGRFECALPRRQRFHHAIAVLDNGRLDLATAAIASARAGLAGLVNYSRQRRPGSNQAMTGQSRKTMADRDPVQLEFASALAAVYATSTLGQQIRDMRAAAPATDPEQRLWSALAKPLLSNTAAQVLTMCRRRAAAQGALRLNHLEDWIGNLEAIITAEGENQIMLVLAGRAGGLTGLRLPGTPMHLPWYLDMLVTRERALAAALDNGDYESTGVVLGRDSAAIELATATQERLAATALVIAATRTGDALARRLVESTAAAYALGCIDTHAAWHTAHHTLSPTRAAEVAAQLRHRYTELADHLPTMVQAFDIPTLPGPIFAPEDTDGSPRTTDKPPAYIIRWMEYAGWQGSWS